MQKYGNFIPHYINFIKTDIWRIRLKNLPPKKSFFIKLLRIILLVFRGFAEDKCQLRASALTFYSLLSIVPVAAMAFGIAKGFGFEKTLQQQLLEKLAGHEEVVRRIIDFAHSLLESTRGGMLAGIGIIILFWSIIKVLGNIERSFNDIWGIKEQRTFARKFSDYLSLILIAPIIVIMSSSVTVFITTQITLITQKVAFLGYFSTITFFMLKLLPYCLLWLLLTFIYMLMPNAKVRFSAGLIAGVTAGTVFQIAQWTYISFQIGVAKYNAIYGSFAALPLFLVWLQISWLIILAGAEISFAFQNVDTYEFEPDSLQISPAFKKLLTLEIVHLVVTTFAAGKKPFTAAKIAHTLEIPIRLVHEIVYELVDSDIFSDTLTDVYKEPAYQPARDINSLTIQHVIDALEQRGISTIPVAETKELKTLSKRLLTFNEHIRQSPENELIKNIV